MEIDNITDVNKIADIFQKQKYIQRYKSMYEAYDTDTIWAQYLPQLKHGNYSYGWQRLYVYHPEVFFLEEYEAGLICEVIPYPVETEFNVCFGDYEEYIIGRNIRHSGENPIMLLRSVDVQVVKYIYSRYMLFIYKFVTDFFLSFFNTDGYEVALYFYYDKIKTMSLLYFTEKEFTLFTKCYLTDIDLRFVIKELAADYDDILKKEHSVPCSFDRYRFAICDYDDEDEDME